MTEEPKGEPQPYNEPRWPITPDRPDAWGQRELPVEPSPEPPPAIQEPPVDPVSTP